jgi:hypothetical protein
MARRRSDAPARCEVESTVEGHRTDMQEKADEIEETVLDVETEGKTLDEIELSGTAEGADEVEQNIESAQDVSVGEFEEESQELEDIHEQTEEYEGELHERADTTTEDAGKIAEASGQIHSDAPKSELDAARKSAEQDVEFLTGHEEAAQDARQESQQLQDDHRNRVDTARSQ